jgi:hypothetical protein
MTLDTERAHVGDLIVIHGHRLGEPRRIGEILEIRGSTGHERYRVRWDDGHEALFYPGNDAVIQHAADSGCQVSAGAAG